MFDRIPGLANRTELEKRVVVGALGALALILLITLGGWVGICLITTVISLAMISEFSYLAFSLKDRTEKRYVLLCLSWFVGVINLIAPHIEFELLTIAFIALFCFYLFTADTHTAKVDDAASASVALDGRDSDFFTHFKELMHSLFGFIYLIAMPLYITRIQAAGDGTRWVMLFFLIVWAGDTAAYFVGKKYGKTRLYVEISPKKTMEGASGGLLAGVIVSLLFKLLFFRAMPWLAILFVPLAVGAFSQVGDLCESFLKRAYGKKDSGSILPGHGGFLDRFDGIVFSAPVMYACIRIFGS